MRGRMGRAGGMGPPGGLAVAGMVLLAACGPAGAKSSAGGYGTPAAPAGSGSAVPSAPAPSPTPPAPAAAGKWTKLAVARLGSLGKVVVDARGRTLYRFDGDTAKPSASHCAGMCAKAWPPALWTGQVKLAGAGGPFGKIKRADGRWQLTLNGWPLYRYAKDAAPGATSGEGVGGKWYASTPTGKKAMVTMKTGSAKSGSGGSSPSYGY